MPATVDDAAAVHGCVIGCVTFNEVMPMRIKSYGPLIAILSLFSVPTVADVTGSNCKPYDYGATGTQQHCPPPASQGPTSSSGVSAKQCSQLLQGNQKACMKKPDSLQAECNAHAKSDYSVCLQNAK
jgi:hypothetical protein